MNHCKKLHSISARKTGKEATTVQESEQESVLRDYQAVGDRIIQLGTGYEGRIGTENIDLPESNKNVVQASNNQICEVTEMFTTKPLGETSQLQFASIKERLDQPEKQATFHEMLPMRHVGSHRMDLNEFHVKHCYYFKTKIGLRELKLAQVVQADQENTNVTCMLSTARHGVRGNVHDSVTTVYVDQTDLVSVVKQILTRLRTSPGFLKEAYLSVTALVDGEISSHFTLQILQSVILRILKTGTQSQTSADIPKRLPSRADTSVKNVKPNPTPTPATVVNAFSGPMITGVCQQQLAPSTHQTPLQFSALKTGQNDIQRPNKSTLTLQAQNLHVPLNPVQGVLQIPVGIFALLAAPGVRYLSIREEQQKSTLYHPMSAPLEVCSPQHKANGVLQVPVEI